MKSHRLKGVSSEAALAIGSRLPFEGLTRKIHRFCGCGWLSRSLAVAALPVDLGYLGHLNFAPFAEKLWLQSRLGVEFD